MRERRAYISANVKCKKCGHVSESCRQPHYYNQGNAFYSTMVGYCSNKECRKVVAHVVKVGVGEMPDLFGEWEDYAHVWEMLKETSKL